MEIPEGSRGYIDSFTCSHTWRSVIADVNTRLYFRWSDQAAMVSADLTVGDISSASDLATKLTSAIGSKTLQSAPVTVTVQANSSTHLLVSAPALAANATFTIYARTSLRRLVAPAGGWIDACGLAGFMTKDLVCVDAAAVGPQDASGEFINLAPYQTIYLHSHIGNPDSYGPGGESTVIASIVVADNSPGDVITQHNNGLTASPIELSNLLADMHFSLRDYNGKLIDTDGHDLSFTLVIE
jgi:hypothetical protein